MKYSNAPSTNDQGESFQSKLEMRRWQELTILQKAGEISELERQVTYRLDVNGYHIAKYIADAVYKDKNGNLIVEDTKSVATATPTYKLKKRLMKAIHGIDILEVYAVPRKIPARKLTTGRKLRRS